MSITGTLQRAARKLIGVEPRPAARKKLHRTAPMNANGYSMADMSRLFADWNLASVTADSYLRTQLLLMRNRSRDLTRSDDYVKSFICACRNNIAGPKGVSLKMDVKNSDGTDDELANDAIEGEWKEFSKPWSMASDGTRVPHFTTSGRFSRVQFEQTCMSTAPRDGEGLIRLVRGYPNKYRFAVQPIAADYLDETKNELLQDGGQIRLGVQTDRWERVTHYWLRKYNPGDAFNTRGNYASEAVPADDIIHYHLPDDFELSRGVPWVHAAATRLKMLGGYEEAALEAARAAACKHEYFEQLPDTNGEYQGDAVDADGNFLNDTEPGQKEILPVGMKVHSVDPVYPHSEHKGFISATLMGVAAGLNVSAMTLTGDLTQANYSSMRAGLLPERDQWTVLQNVLLISQIELPIFLEWLLMSLLAGAIKLPNGKPLPASSFEKFAKGVMFQGRRWPWVDPLKDLQSQELGLKLKVNTRSDIVGQQGGDLEETFKTLNREEALAATNGIELPDLSGAAAPVETDGDGGGDTSDAEQLSAEMNVYGIGVRAGAITPTIEDENHFRERAGLPKITAEAKTAWSKDGGVRRPITLVPPEGSRPAGGFGQPAPKPPENEDENKEDKADA